MNNEKNAMIRRRSSGLEMPLSVEIVKSSDARIALSVVVPCMNEEEVLAETNHRLLTVLATDGH